MSATTFPPCFPVSLSPGEVTAGFVVVVWEGSTGCELGLVLWVVPDLLLSAGPFLRKE